MHKGLSQILPPPRNLDISHRIGTQLSLKENNRDGFGSKLKKLLDYDPLENRRLLRSLGIADSDLKFPFIVRFGDDRKLDFTITKRKGVDSTSVLYEAYRLKGQWNERVPVIIKSYIDAAHTNSYGNCITDLYLYQKESRVITADLQHCNIALVKTKGFLTFYQSEGQGVEDLESGGVLSDDDDDDGLNRVGDSGSISEPEGVEIQESLNYLKESDYDSKHSDIDVAENPLHKKSNLFEDEKSTISLEDSDFKSKAEIRSLWNPKDITLPLSIMIGDVEKEQFIVNETVGRSQNGEIYKGFFSNNPSRILVLKVFRDKDMKSFKNEITALSKISRLVKADHKNSVIVESSVEGPFILDVWSRLNKISDSEKYKSLLQKYQQIPQVLKEKYGVININVHPYNVVVDKEENLHVLDLEGVTIQDASDQEKVNTIETTLNNRKELLSL